MATKLTLLERRAQAARAAQQHLSRVDDRMGALIRAIGVYRPNINRDVFTTLVHSIVSQQVSMSAAATILKRFRAACGGRFTPESILRMDATALRAVGLSQQKARYMHSLAEHFADGRLSAAKLRRMSDEEAIQAAMQVKGVGRWTAEMLLIFCLERPDVWPIDDLGIRKAVMNFAGLPEMPDRTTLVSLAEPWRPYRSYAAWYLWRSLEGPLMPGIQVDGQPKSASGNSNGKAASRRAATKSAANR